MNEPGALFHKPASIIAAKNIVYAVIFLGILNTLLNRLTGDPSSFWGTRELFIAGFIFIVLFLLSHQIGLGRKWARTVLLILFVLSIVLFPITYMPLLKANMLVGTISMFGAVLLILAFVFLFSKKSNHWFLSFEK